MAVGNVADINQLCTVRNMSDSPEFCDPVNNVTFPFENKGSRLLEEFISVTPFPSLPLRSGVGTSKGPAGVQRMGIQSETCPLALNQKYLLRSYCALGAGDSAVNTAEPAPAILGQSSTDVDIPARLWLHVPSVQAGAGLVTSRGTACSRWSPSPSSLRLCLADSWP